MDLTPQLLKHALELGVRAAGGHPCSVCAAGVPLADFPHVHGGHFGYCTRNVQYKLMAERQEFDIEKRTFLLDGHTHECSTVALLRQGGIEITGRNDSDGDQFMCLMHGRNRTVRPVLDKDEALAKLEPGEIIVVGHTDGVMFDRYLLEHKATKEWSFKNRYMSGDMPFTTVGQMRLYMLCLGLEAGFVAVKNRHTSQTEFIRVERNDAYIYGRAVEFFDVLAMLGRDERTWMECKPQDPNEQRFCDACKVMR